VTNAPATRTARIVYPFCMRRAVPWSLCALLFPTVVRASPEVARRAREFTDSVGVATHWGYPDTPYGGRYAEVKQLLIASGIRHVRDGLHDHLHDLAAAGIDATVVVDPKDGSTMADLVGAIRDFNAAGRGIVAIEGTNEPDLFWPQYHASGYLGQVFPEGAVQFQKDLFTTVKADPRTSALVVLGIALGTTLTPDHPSNPLGDAGELAPFVDWGNFHPYPGGNAFNFPRPYDTIEKYYWTSAFPSLPVEGWGTDVKPWIVYYEKPYAPKPMGATETGYSTTTGGIPERVVGKYLPRLYLEFFRKGIVRTFVYEFVDEWAQPTNREANFGMLRNDLTPKPSYTAVKNLLVALADGDAVFDPGTLDFDLAISPVTVKASTVRPGAADTDVVYDRTEYVRHLVLAKSNGARYLVLWHDIADEDSAGGVTVELTPPAMPAALTLYEPFETLNVLEIDDAGEIRSRTVSGMPIALSVPDRPLIVEMLPRALADGGHTEGGRAPEADGGTDLLASSDAATTLPDAPRGMDALDGPAPGQDAGCGCRAAGSALGKTPWILAALAAYVHTVRRRRSHGNERSTINLV
jgi:hypothetical protein